MKLVDDVRLLHRRWSTRIAASQAGLVLFWVGLPPEWKTAIPNWVLAIVVAIFAVAFISAQAVQQPALNRPKDGDPQ